MERKMNQESYEKPTLKFVALRNEEAVAATCWGYHGTGTPLYCDISGEGYVSFQIAGGSCSLSLINVMYYDGDGNCKAATSDQYTALYNILVQSGGAEGNPYKGEGSIVIPGKPDPTWS